ncbi:LOW QUALITY PROTEIN: hypothetical protein MXB_5443 [Myxobolus squamalis]|nr:LOW QUALITY PROTEIN: hypothetical protein MXB_5443 [Myxobolus squamalis]
MKGEETSNLSILIQTYLNLSKYYKSNFITLGHVAGSGREEINENDFTFLSSPIEYVDFIGHPL